jgi:hypothetical protein
VEGQNRSVSNVWEESVMNIAKAVGASLIALMSMCPLDGRADPGGLSVVYPTGLYPYDVTIVQAALDRGGTVLLKAVNVAGIPTPFNFGTGVGVVPEFRR